MVPACVPQANRPAIGGSVDSTRRGRLAFWTSGGKNLLHVVRQRGRARRFHELERGDSKPGHRRSNMERRRPSFFWRGDGGDRAAVIALVNDEGRAFLGFRQGRVVRRAASAFYANRRGSLVVFLRHSARPRGRDGTWTLLPRVIQASCHNFLK